MSSKGFDFVAVAALVATLEEENEKFDLSIEGLKAQSEIVERHRSQIIIIQTEINAAIDKLKQSPIPGTPWHDERQRKEHVSNLAEEARRIAGMQMRQVPGQNAAAAQNMSQYLQQQYQNATPPPPPPPLSMQSWKKGEPW